LALKLVSPAFGQYVPIIQACSRDVVQFCAPDRPEGTRLTECIETHFQDFTERCKMALAKIAAVREACGMDIDEQCPGVKPSAGRILLCVKQHFAALSEQCKDAIGSAAARKVRAH
jgi:hypothetical protein